MKTYDHARPNGFPSWFDLMVPDVKSAATFYEQVFGWTYDESGPEFGHYHMAHTHERAAAGLGQGSDTPPAWTVYYAADDVAAMTARAKALGASVLSGPFEVPEQGHMSIIQDPTGAVFGLWEPINHLGAGISDTHGAMTWCEVNTGDAEAAKAFYTGLFEATAEPLDYAGTTYYVLKKDDTGIGGILQMNEQWQGVPPHWMAYFQVNSTDEAAKTAETAGGVVSVQPFDTPYGRLAVINDPAGAVFSVMQPPAA